MSETLGPPPAGPRAASVRGPETIRGVHSVESPGSAPSPVGGDGGHLRLALMLGIAALAVLGAIVLRDQLNFEALAANHERLIGLRDANYPVTVMVFMGIYVLLVAFSLPGATIATLVGGFLFATFPGVLYNVGAATIGASAIFLAARWGLGERLAARMDASRGAIRRIKDGIDDNQWSMLLLMRLLPAIPFFVANLLPALLGVAFHRFVLTTFLGIIPGTLVFTSVGAGLGGVFAREETPDMGVIFEPHILLPILGLSAVAALPMLLKVYRARKAAQA